MLQKITKKRHGGAAPKTSDSRRRFLHAYEETFGNVSASCEYAGISRRTFYRWLKSNTEINRKFRVHLENIKPQEKQADYLEAKLMDRVRDNDTAAIIFGLKTKAKHRGYVEKVNPASSMDDSMLSFFRQQLSERASLKGISYSIMVREFLDEMGHQLKPEIRSRLIKEIEAEKGE